MTRSTLWFFLFFALAMTSHRVTGQDQPFVLSREKLSDMGSILLGNQPGWKFHQGADPAWIHPAYNEAGWQALRPQDLSIKQADENGFIRGCYRFTFNLDSSLAAAHLHMRVLTYGSARVYINGKEVGAKNKAGEGVAPFQPTSLAAWYTPQAVSFHPDRENTMVIFLNEYRSHWLEKYSFINLAPPLRIWIGNENYDQRQAAMLQSALVYYGCVLTAITLLMSLFWLLFRQNPSEKTLFWIALNTSFLLAFMFFGRFTFELIGLFRNSTPGWITVFTQLLSDVPGACWLGTIPLLSAQLLSGKIGRAERIILYVGIGLVVGATFFSGLPLIVTSKMYIYCTYFLFLFLRSLYTVITYRKQLTKARWAVVIGLLLTVAGAMGVGYLIIINYITTYFLLYNLVASFTILSFPISLLVYIAIRFQENLVTIQNKALEVAALSREKQQILSRQNELLEQQVEARTVELKASQTQLIQKEKLASLGELTAGIAHEIQNPLNFVNNYSEVNMELIEELHEEVDRDNKEEIKALLTDLGDNERKIHHHGRRADAIVRGMLEHARAAPGEKQPTDLNALADEYLRLAYHGLRAKDSNFQCELITDFEPNLGKVEVAPAELGRVLLNLFNNAFYAVRQKQLVAADQAYTPTVWVSTHHLDDKVEIKVRDNGTGMPEEVKAKIFQPFFTTKPTGEGTVLGLSLSYDIITKGHGGTLRVASCVGEGTEFVVELPNL